MRLKSKMENNETHIIRRILKGETALYENFLNQYGQQVFSLIARIICNQEDAEELTQDVFLKAFQHLSSFKPKVLSPHGYIPSLIIRRFRQPVKGNLIPLPWMIRYSPTFRNNRLMKR